MSNVENPIYTIVDKNIESIEIRRYEPMLIAEVEIPGARKEAIKDGFRILADYIFGNNKIKPHNTKYDNQEVTKIPMTAPVQQQWIDNSWLISFIMPAEYDIDSLPEPVNKDIKIKKIESKDFVVIRFAGFGSDSNIEKHKIILLDYIKDNNIKYHGSPKYAFYNPPWTLPIMRRNEVMFEIEMSDD